MEKRWNILCADEKTTGVLQNALKIHPALCRILMNRGINSFESARHFFRPELKDLHNPWLMKDMASAVQRIQQAIGQGEKILVYGDYDVDGTTSVACVYRFLLSIYSREKVDFYLPHRYREGYGISKAGIDFAVQQGFSLIISLDCGIKSTDLITAAKLQGIDFIVCDHHLPDDQLPPAVAILNPKQPGCEYPYKELCGCGIGFKLICALTEKLGLSPELPHQFLDLVATAIAADIVPMTGENRILAYYGIRKANTSPNYGIKALKDLSGLHTELHISNLVFIIAPRVNAAGRMDDARKAVQLFIAQTPEEAAFYATQLHADNFDRREADRTITEEALASIARNPDWKDRKSTLVYEPHWHKGVVGIVASRLIDHYYRPTIVLTQSGDYASGSARSIPGFNLYEAIHACKDYLVGYGGHFAAAGMTLEIDKVEAFREKFEEVVARTIRPDSLQPGINIDAEVDFKDLTMGFYSILAQMEPFGPDNPRPIFITRKVTDSGNSKIIKEQHVRFAVQQDRCSFSGIGFGLAAKFPLLSSRQPLDIVFTLEENSWNGQKLLQLKVLDVALHHTH